MLTGNSTDNILSAAPIDALDPLLTLELGPALHGDLGRVELSLVFQTGLLCLFACRLSSVTPREVVEFPEGVGWKHKVPDRKGEEIDEHPNDVGWRVGRNDNKQTWKTENKGEKNQGNNLNWLLDDRGNNLRMLTLTTRGY